LRDLLWSGENGTASPTDTYDEKLVVRVKTSGLRVKIGSDSPVQLSVTDNYDSSLVNQKPMDHTDSVSCIEFYLKS
jgi:hypothetical protein